MGRLFWKFFIFIWLAQVIGTMSVMIALKLKHGFVGHGPPAETSRTPALLLESAAATLQHGGPMALRSMIENTAPNRLLAVDENNRELLGRTVDPAALQRANEESRQEQNSARARRVEAPDGHRYLLFDPITGSPGDRTHARLPKPQPGWYGLFPPEPLAAHLVASLVVAALLAHYCSRPIRTLHSAFRAAAAGNLRARVGTAVEKRHDELADLLREFDRMAEQLRALMASQRRLLHDVSHEVRSPLARMQAAIGLARQQPENVQDLICRIERDVVRIDRLIGQLLTLSRLETSDSGILQDNADIDEILADIHDSAQFEAQASGKTVHLLGKCGAVIRGQPELLHRAIENVVRNAVKHTQQGTRVHIQVERHSSPDTLKISVSDNGRGVPDAELDAIFKPFFRSSEADRGADGHGLGLAIAKRIMEAHGGTIRAFNLSQKGLCVELTFPTEFAGDGM
jgi:two-component system OmpR family sensor kinase